MTKDDALKLALEFIERVNKDGWILADFEPQMYATITAIKEALANVATENTSKERVDEMQKQRHEQEPVCDKDLQGCWSVRCQLGKKCKNTPPLGFIRLLEPLKPS